MSGDVVSRWGLVFHWERAATGDVRSVITLDDVFARARSAYLDRCAVLAAFLGEEAAGVRVASDRPGTPGTPDTPGTPAPADIVTADGALVGVSVVEVRPTSFDMAVRIRPAGEGEPAPVNLRRTMVVERAASGERLEIPREVRNEFIALQLAARDLC